MSDKLEKFTDKVSDVVVGAIVPIMNGIDKLEERKKRASTRQNADDTEKHSPKTSKLLKSSKKKRRANILHARQQKRSDSEMTSNPMTDDMKEMTILDGNPTGTTETTDSTSTEPKAANTTENQPVSVPEPEENPAENPEEKTKEETQEIQAAEAPIPEKKEEKPEAPEEISVPEKTEEKQKAPEEISVPVEQIVQDALKQASSQFAELLNNQLIVLVDRFAKMEEEQTTSNQQNARMVTLLTDLNQKFEQLQANQTESEQQKGEVLQLRAELEQAKQDSQKKDDLIADLQKQLDEANQQNQEKDNSVADLQKQLDEANQQNQEKDHAVADLQKQLDEAKQETQTKVTELTQAVSERNALAQKLEESLKELTIIKTNQENAESQSEQKIADLQAEIQKVSHVAEEFANSTKSYRTLMKAVYQCPSMEKYLADKGLPETYSESMDAIITFVAVAGANYNFAWDMVNYMIKYKYANREPMTENEKLMMDIANQFYQEKFQHPDEDVLVIPAGLEKISDCNVLFKKQEMQDIEKATGSFRNATTLYVPAMREYQSKLFKAKAIVAGK